MSPMASMGSTGQLVIAKVVEHRRRLLGVLLQPEAHRRLGVVDALISVPPQRSQTPSTLAGREVT